MLVFLFNTASYASRVHQIMWTCGPPTIDSGIRSRSIEEQGAPSVKCERLLSANSNEWRDRRWASWTEGPAPQSMKADPPDARHGLLLIGHAAWVPASSGE